MVLNWLLPRFHVPCSVLAFYVFSTLRSISISRFAYDLLNRVKLGQKLFQLFCPPHEVDRNYLDRTILRILRSRLGPHLFVKVPQPEDSEVTFAVFESSCHLLLPV